MDELLEAQPALYISSQIAWFVLGKGYIAVIACLLAITKRSRLAFLLLYGVMCVKRLLARAVHGLHN